MEIMVGIPTKFTNPAIRLHNTFRCGGFPTLPPLIALHFDLMLEVLFDGDAF